MVVLDSNIYISALLFGGNPRVVIELAKEGVFEIAVSAVIKAEVESVLAEKFSWPTARIKEATTYLWSMAHFVSPRESVSDCVDPDDNMVLECAIEVQAQAIVTGDGHLLRLHPYRGILILTAKQFLESRHWE